jgi:transposase-like protein
MFLSRTPSLADTCINLKKTPPICVFDGGTALAKTALVEVELTIELMPNKNEPRRQYDESFKRAAVEYLQKTGSTVEDAAAELGIPSAELLNWSKKAAAAPERPAKNLTGMARLKAENEALRNEVLHLQVQWDILKTTLGVLSTTVGTHELA